MKNTELEKIISNVLNTKNIQDYAPNGLQVAGCRLIKSVITGVTASQELLKSAIQKKAEAVIVHHGYFWKNEPLVIKGIKKNRLKMILENDINLYSWHLPLDIHPKLGNNAQLGNLLGIKIVGNITPLLLWGKFPESISGTQLENLIHKKLNRKPFWYGETGPNHISNIAWCTGAGQSLIDKAAEFGVDAFITGDVSEPTIHSAKEQKIHFYAAGHHATECGGILSITKWLKENTHLSVSFTNISNPA